MEHTVILTRRFFSWNQIIGFDDEIKEFYEKEGLDIHYELEIFYNIKLGMYTVKVLVDDKTR